MIARRSHLNVGMLNKRRRPANIQQAVQGCKLQISCSLPVMYLDPRSYRANPRMRIGVNVGYAVSPDTFPGVSTDDDGMRGPEE
jgi:hypothetical protein